MHLAGLATALSARGHQVAVVARHDAPGRPPEIWMAGGIHVINVAAGPRASVAEADLLPALGDFTAGLESVIDDFSPDVVHAHRWITGRSCLSATWARGLPLVQSFHGLAREHPAGSDRTGSELTLVRRAAHLVAGSSAELFDLVRLGASMSSVTVAPPAVDLTLFRPDGVTEPKFRPRLVAMGRLTSDRGFADAVRALAQVPDAELVVVGGPQPSDVSRNTFTRGLMALADEVGVLPRVEIRGRTHRGELASLLRSADAVLCLPTREPSGFPPVEAMACGTPVIVTALGAHADVVVDGITGLHVEPGRPEQVAAAARRLLADDSARATMADAAATRARQRYGWDKVAASVEAGYARAMQVTNSGRRSRSSIS